MALENLLPKSTFYVAVFRVHKTYGSYIEKFVLRSDRIIDIANEIEELSQKFNQDISVMNYRLTRIKKSKKNEYVGWQPVFRDLLFRRRQFVSLPLTCCA